MNLKILKHIIYLTLCFTIVNTTIAQDIVDLELQDESDIKVLDDVDDLERSTIIDVSDMEEVDDLESLKSDIGNVVQDIETNAMDEDSLLLDAGITPKDESIEVVNEKSIINENEAGKTVKKPAVQIFDVGDVEQDLIKISSLVEGKIPEEEWDGLATSSKVDRYVIQEGDWLWNISKNLFGSGFYYSKIWSLNPHITNPHEIEPGMILVFDTGSSDAPPEVRLGEFKELLENRDTGFGKTANGLFDFTQFGDESEPPWMAEREKLLEQGVFFQLASEDSYKDLSDTANVKLKKEYEKYEPPEHNIIIQEPGEEYDNTGFDKNSKITFDYKEGFFLNTFVTTNVVQDLGFIESIKNENIWIHRFDHIFINFDDSVKVKPGDKFSVYSADGKVTHEISDREGHRYTVNAQVKVLRKKDHLWECIVTEITGQVERKDRVTVYTPKINRIVRTFNKRSIEAAIISSFMATANGLSFGDVVYLDRGRADGVELGNVFEIYGFTDRGTGKRITPNPAYKTGELTVITLTDNFATALISNNKNEVGLGAISITKTEEAASRTARLSKGLALKEMKRLEENSLDKLDIELNLDDMSKDLLDKADQIQLSEDELEELERQEREKSVIKEHERDLRELERLESEIVEAENSFNEKKLDEDKFLEQQDLEEVEKGVAQPDKNAFENIDEIENDLVPQYLDEDLNAKENPYGLTEFDLEEIDELLNTEPL